MYISTMCVPGSFGGQKASDALNLGSQMVVNFHVGAEKLTWSSGGAARTLNWQAISQAQILFLLFQV